MIYINHHFVLYRLLEECHLVQHLFLFSLDCLLVLARKQPLSVVECVSQMQKLVETCTRLHPHTSNLILTALLPLSRLSHSLRESLVIMLRTTLFHK